MLAKPPLVMLAKAGIHVDVKIKMDSGLRQNDDGQAAFAAAGVYLAKNSFTFAFAVSSGAPSFHSVR
jgi:hypothetical protein